jgi:hypothetical protein
MSDNPLEKVQAGYDREHAMADIEHRLTNHAPVGATGVVLDALTAMFIDVGHKLIEALPEGREKSLALTKLEELSMWSKAAVARNQGG